MLDPILRDLVTSGVKQTLGTGAVTVDEIPLDNESLSQEVRRLTSRADRMERVLTHPTVTCGVPLVLAAITIGGFAKWMRN